MVNLARRQRPWGRYILITLVVAGLAGGAYYFGQAKIRHWRAGRLARQAGDFLGKNDMESAALAARRGLEIDRTSVGCWKVLAEVCEAHRMPEALFARSRAIELEKASLDSVLQCANTALKLGDSQAAAKALEKLPAERRNDAQYQATLGRVGFALGKLDMAVDGYSNAVKLAPTNDEYRLGQATVILQRGWIEQRADARETLERLSHVPQYRLAALRLLLRDSLASGETSGAVERARELATGPGGTFSDKIALLDLLRRNKSEDFRPTLEAMEQEARGDTGKTLELGLWMNRNRQYREEIEWSHGFTSEEWADVRVCASVAVSILGTADWTALQSFTQSGDWHRFEYLRCGLLARSLREQGKLMDSRTQWALAVTAAARVQHGTAELANLVIDWGWEVPLMDLLKTLVKDPKEAGWASRVLMPMVAKNEDTPGLWEATARFMEDEANNDAAANNFALYSLLLGRDVPRACALAAKLYEKHRNEGSYVSTYAFCLHMLGKTQEALNVLEALSRDQLQSPDVAVYYGILLAANRDWEKATKVLDQAKQASLLPEERYLVRNARQQIDEARSGLK